MKKENSEDRRGICCKSRQNIFTKIFNYNNHWCNFNSGFNYVFFSW